MKSKILSALRGQDGYVSGQELCERFGVTRAAIWKGIRQLKEEGYEIEAVQNRGYRLLTYPDTVSGAELKSRMKTKWAGRELVYLRTVDSTNTYAKKMAEDGAPHGTLVVADHQSSGKGRRGRGWVTAAGTTIAVSIVVRPQIRPEKASMLTLAAGLAAARGIEKTVGLPVQVKWPNDLVLNGKKLSGTLTEMSTELDGIHYVVIGTGINANITEFPKGLKEIATSLQIELGHPVDRGALICAYMEELEAYYDRFMQREDLSLLKEEYEARLANRNREVRVLEPDGAYTGIARGIDALGRLLVEREDGAVEKVYAGEVSVRGIYQYC